MFEFYWTIRTIYRVGGLAENFRILSFQLPHCFLCQVPQLSRLCVRVITPAMCGAVCKVQLLVKLVLSLKLQHTYKLKFTAFSTFNKRLQRQQLNIIYNIRHSQIVFQIMCKNVITTLRTILISSHELFSTLQTLPKRFTTTLGTCMAFLLLTTNITQTLRTWATFRHR